MRILVILAHYFAAEAKPRHASTDGSREADRKAAVEAAIRSWRAHFGPSAMLDVGSRSFHMGPRSEDTVDIVVTTANEKHLMTSEFCTAMGVRVAKHTLDQPRMLGFTAQGLFAAWRNLYDLFVFSEDDLRINDPALIDKLVWFNRTFGPRRVLMPNRVELNPAGHAPKTYIDGDLAPALAADMKRHVPDEETLYGSPFGREGVFQRARNPHSGFYALTRDQLSYWMSQPHWLDRDCSFVSPLESAATLGIAKTFSIYKPFGASSGFLEIEHLDDRFSTMKLPVRDRL